MAKPLVIADLRFDSQRAAIEHARRILYDGQPGTRIADSDVPFVEALLCARADKTLDLHGLNVIAYCRDWQDGPIKRTICFWAVLEDGTHVDFSFMKAIRLLAQDVP